VCTCHVECVCRGGKHAPCQLNGTGRVVQWMGRWEDRSPCAMSDRAQDTSSGGVSKVEEEMAQQNINVPTSS